MVDHTPLSIDQSASQVPPPADPMMNRTRSQEMVDDPRLMMMDEDPLLISQTLTFVTDEMLLTFQQAPFSFCKSSICDLMFRGLMLWGTYPF